MSACRFRIGIQIMIATSKFWTDRPIFVNSFLITLNRLIFNDSQFISPRYGLKFIEPSV